MINSYSNGPSPVEALSLYIQMLREGAKANKFTFPSLLKACNLRSSALEGKQIHCQVLKLEREMDGFIQSTLIDMYANSGCFDYAAQVFEEISQLNVVCCTAMINGYIRFGSLDKAGQLFNEMAERDVISWSAMISGYVQMGRYKEAFSLFHEMQLENIKPNQAILLALLSMSSSLRSLRLGQWVHAYMIKSRVSWNVGLSTSGVDMYSKCGALEMALKLFRKIPRKDVGSWNAMISGLAMHGHGQEAIELFHEMQVAGFRPNDITFINILNACSHSGLVDMGQCLFESMIHNHGIDPKVQHYGCLVDLYGRAGLLSEAERVVKLIPMKPDAMALGSLINACRIHGNLELGERIGRLLIQDSPSTDGYYVILANLYASFERWDKVVEIRDLMGSRGSERNPGYSLIEVNGEARQITVCDERESCMIPN
ncbi:pentatricopeptide repeat-containing protein At5g66520-like [Amborella trichopoda]|uniref:pentatricopeptide repeat-containing protein At5g66520-like n=1 Tax=Amborella trichopoda TaxID=13333 RepID=UPI0005D3BFA1|nr:pentatricopeptide repeat-containing protein At5g66520-like [Amborella trichopoda]|eukprot:XP_011626240.1 pentatricopeptide repeat-containing protein At5g66520-like [Amborella trichopoda]